MHDMILAAWSAQTFESKVREFMSIIIFVLIAWNAIRTYGQGQKGKALMEVIFGLVISLFVTGKENASSLADGIKSILGF
ncbi:MAG TPA: hypothetical protein VJ824_15915 [Bacillota bacterium]|nr:hypothetical protein [Bacillota bacterium]